MQNYWTRGSDCLSWSHHFKSFMVATMIWLTVTENLCHKWPRICFTCRKHFPVISLFMTYHWVCNSSNRTGATSGAGTAYPSWAPEFTPWFFVGFVSLDLYFYVWYFVDRCLFFCPFSFGHCVVWPSLIYGFLLPPWYLQTLLN